MNKKLSRFAVAILVFVLAVSPVGCGMNTAGGKGPDEEILNSMKSMKTLEGDFEPIPKVVHRVRHKRSAK